MIPATSSRRALTLLETLAALTILAGVMAAVGAALGPVTRAARAIEPDSDRGSLRLALELLRRDVEHAARNARAVRPDADADRVLLLTSNAPAGNGDRERPSQAGWREVRWERERDALWRTERLVFGGAESRRVVIRGVAQFDVGVSRMGIEGDQRGRGTAERWEISIRTERGEQRSLAWERIP